MIRRGVCVAVVACIWIVLAALVAGLDWSTPLLPQKQIELTGSDFRVVIGAGVQDDRALRVAAVGTDGSALQARSIGSVRAEDFPVLRYRFDGFPRTLELSLVFRRAGEDDVHSETIPFPGDGWTSINLSRLPGWSGDIVELGFAQYATPDVAPASVAFRPFRFDQAELWSPSWRGGLAALSTSWFGYTPWALLSVSALGPQREVANPPPLQPFAVAGCVLSLLAAALILRWSRSRLVRRAVIVLAVLWCTLDLVWLADLRGKHDLTEDIYAGHAWSVREQLAPDQDLARAAAAVRAYFAAQPVPRRILVTGEAKYVFLRLVYLLLPLNAAPLETGVAPPSLRDTYILVYRDSRWRYDATLGALLDDRGRRLDPSGSIFRDRFDAAERLEPVLESGDLHLYAFRAGQGS